MLPVIPRAYDNNIIFHGVFAFVAFLWELKGAWLTADAWRELNSDFGLPACKTWYVYAFISYCFTHSAKHYGVGLVAYCSVDGNDFLQLAWTDAEGRPQNAVLLLNQQELLKMPNIVCHTDAGADTSPAVNSVFVLEPNPFNPGMHKLGVMLRAGHSLRRGDSATCTVGQGALLWDTVARGLYSFFRST